MGQVLNSSLVALFSGVCATSIFLFARNLATTSNELAGVDATQASEVIFALIGGMLLLGGELPSPAALAGLVMIIVGLLFFVKYQNM
jgi:drug/metabolite transporter (DMT)-like permease